MTNNQENLNIEYEDQNPFIIESAPIFYEIDNDKKLEAIIRLKKALENINNGIEDGISLEDAILIVESDVQNVRSQYSTRFDIYNDSLSGYCGLTQALTCFPLLEIGLKITVNNTSKLPDGAFRHAFATCIFPIKDGNHVYEKQFLLDVTYRQFFTTDRCNEEAMKRNYDSLGNVDAGYFISKSADGIKFAQELLKKGYVELTEENARWYGYGFSCERISLCTKDDEIKRITSHSGKEYIDSINNPELQEELDYSVEEFEEWNYNISLYNYIETIKRDENVENKRI